MGGSQRAGANGKELQLVVDVLLLPWLPTLAPDRFPVRSLSESVDSSSAEDVDPPDVVSSLPRDVVCDILDVFFDKQVVDVAVDVSDLTEAGGDLRLPIKRHAKQSRIKSTTRASSYIWKVKKEKGLFSV